MVAAGWRSGGNPWRRSKVDPAEQVRETWGLGAVPEATANSPRSRKSGSRSPSSGSRSSKSKRLKGSCLGSSKSKSPRLPRGARSPRAPKRLPRGAPSPRRPEAPLRARRTSTSSRGSSPPRRPSASSPPRRRDGSGQAPAGRRPHLWALGAQADHVLRGRRRGGGRRHRRRLADAGLRLRHPPGPTSPPAPPWSKTPTDPTLAAEQTQAEFRRRALR